MPVATNIVIADAQATPVNHTFVPLGKDGNGVFWFEDQSQAAPVGYWKISVDFKRPPPAAPGQATKDRYFRAKISVYEPQLEVVSNSTISGIAPSPLIAYQMRSHCEFVSAERSTLQNRKDLRKMVPLIIQNALMGNVIEDLQYLS